MVAVPRVAVALGERRQAKPIEVSRVVTRRQPSIIADFRQKVKKAKM
jgi:hypothetical protein